MNKIKSETEFKKLCDWCTQTEPKLKSVIQEFDYPPFWHRKADFATLVLTILEQQVSLASAKATYNKLLKKVMEVSPQKLLKLSEEELQECGFSRQKIKYTRILATEFTEGRLNLNDLNCWDEPKIRKQLIQLKALAIGPSICMFY